MKFGSVKQFNYSCTCGHRVSVFCDSGAPQEFYKCRRCGTKIKRIEV